MNGEFSFFAKFLIISGDEASLFEEARIGAESHGSSFLSDGFLFFHDVDDMMSTLLLCVEFLTRRISISQDIPRKFYRHELRSETDTEIGDFLLSGILYGTDHSLDASRPEATRHTYSRHT